MGAAVTAGARFWYRATKLVPAPGGSYAEALVGRPRYVNPLYAAANDVDRDLERLIFAGLTRYGPDGRIEPDLAERIEISTDGKTYTFTLAPNLTWHDDVPLTADDVVFTIETIQNPDYGSPLRLNWQGVTAEKVDDRTVRFTLTNAYAPFLENTTVGIIPEHVWASIEPARVPLAEGMLKPVGAGPYRFNRLTKEKDGTVQSYTLRAAPRPDRPGPYIQEITLKFFDSEADTIAALNRRDVDGIGFVSAQNLDRVKAAGRSVTIHELEMPRYFTIFANQTQSKILADRTVREALMRAIDRETIVREVLRGSAEVMWGPIPPGLPGAGANPNRYPYTPDEARVLLETAGWKDTNGDGIREKTAGTTATSTPLTLTLAVPDNDELRLVAEEVEHTWREVGAALTVQILPSATLQQDLIRPRKYDLVLFGEILGAEPDPFSFWHSSQKKNPGLNLALYDNRAADRLLEEARQTLDPAARRAKYEEFSKLVVEDIPAFFLYAPTYLYPVSNRVKGIPVSFATVPAQRFTHVEEWYTNARRVRK